MWTSKRLYQPLALALALSAMNPVHAEGITAGLLTSISKDGYVVEGVAIDGPSEDAGLLPGDRITGLYSMNMDRLSPELVGKAIQQALKSSAVAVPMKIEGGGNRSSVALVEPKEQDDFDVFLTDSSKDTAIVRILHFGPHTADRMRHVIEHYPSKNLIIDLRGNTGGLMASAVATADFFLSSGLEIAWEFSEGNTVAHRAQSPAAFDGKVAILIDGRTASAAELFTLALTENLRAISVGWPSYGKSRIDQVQVDGRKIPVGHYSGPGRTALPHEGIDPMVAIQGTDPDFIGRIGAPDPARDIARSLM